MTIFNIQHTVENGLIDRVSSLFTVLNDDAPIKRAFDKSQLLGAFVGSGLYTSQGNEPDITGTGQVVRNGGFEAIRVVPRQMVVFNTEALKSELVQSFAEGLEYQRFVGGIGDEADSSPILSPFVDGVVNGNKENNVIIEPDSFLKAYGSMNKVGVPYIVFNPNIDGASEAVKAFLEIYPNAIVTSPAWLSGTQHMDGIKGFITTTGAMTLGKFTEPKFEISDPDSKNNVTLRYWNETFGLETFKRATAIIGTPVKPTKTALKKGII